MLRSRETEILIPRVALGRGYAYDGKQIDIYLESELEIDDSLLFDTEVKSTHRLNILDRPALSGHAKLLAEPEDAFDFFVNLAAIPTENKLITIALMIAGGLMILANALLGLHDQMSPEGLTVFYSHVDTDGDSQSPFLNSLFGCGAMGAGLWFFIRHQLSKYMTLSLRSSASALRRQTRVSASDLVHGRGFVPPRNIIVRVVAYNEEKGQYRRGSGTNVRTVSFATPARTVKIYERELRFVPATRTVENYLDGDIDFQRMFAALYPPLAIGSDHGLSVRWEVQLLHPEFVDQELVADSTSLRYEDFLDG